MTTFDSLNHSFEKAILRVIKNGMPRKDEIKNQELFNLIKSEASERLKSPEYLYQGGVVADLDSGRMKYQDEK